MNPLRIYVKDDYSFLPSLLEGEKELFLVHDANLQHAADELTAVIKEAGSSTLRGSIAISTSETLKTMDSVMDICRFLLENGASRKALVLALGGGITTDMAGFAASIYKRGVRFANLPTTLLAQVDAAIGGKTGVNLESYKNILGVINQPEFTYISSGVLASLPQRDLLSGAAELLKTFIIADADFYQKSVKMLKDGLGVSTELVQAAAAIKAGVVERDEKENGERRTLNLGHTVAHAIEWWQTGGDGASVEGRSDYSHGEAVAIGLVKAAELSEVLGVCEKGLASRIKSDLEASGLPTECPIPVETIAAAIRQDKKAVGDSIWFVLIRAIGEVEVRFMPVDEVLSGLSN